MKLRYILPICFLITFYTGSLYSQGGETVAAASGSPIGSLPFTANGTTVGKVDNYNGNTTGYGALGVTFFDGPDWLYYYCATSTAPIIFNLGFTPDPVNGVYPSVSVWDGNPNTTGNLIQYTTAVGDIVSSTGEIFTPVAGQCYYFMVDNDPGSTHNGFPFTFTIENTPTPPASPLEPSCSNMGFEDNNFTGWQGTWSNIVSTSATGSQTPTYTPFYFNTTSNQHSITSGAGVDPVAGIPVVCPGQGAHSLRLGDGHVGDRGGATIQQRFSVNTSNALFTYNYAVIVDDGSFGGGTPHDGTNQPFFKVEIFSSTGAIIPCGQYLVTGGSGIPNFTQIPGSGVYYRNWTSVFVDLSAYIGSFVTVKYSVADCSLGAHACYAYIDAACAAMTVPATTYICPNGTGTITSPLSGVSYSWTKVGNPAVLGTAQSLSVSPLVATTYQCVITNPSGCSTTLTFPVDIYPPATVTSTSQAICAGASTTLVATGSGAGAGATYSWAPSGGTGATTTALSPASTTTYTCTYHDPNGCSATGTGTITINPAPPAPTTTPVAYCINATPNSLSSSVTATNGCTLNWYGTTPTGGTSTSTPPTVSTSTAGQTTYYVSQTNGNGCEGPRGTIVVTINALPTINVNSPSTCPGMAVTLTASGSAGVDSYLWSTTETTSSISVAPMSATSYTVTGTNSTTGCSNTATSNVVINGTLTMTVTDTTICNGGTAILIAHGATNYTWSTGETTQSITVSPTSTTIYTVDGNTSGCTGSATSTVTVNPVPNVTVNSSTICNGVAINVVASPDLPGGTYSWSPNIGTNASNSVSPSSTTNYTVTYTLNGCSNTGSGTISVNPVPTVAVATTTICAGTQGTLSAVTNPSGGTYLWTPGNLTTQSITVSPASSTPYSVVYTLNGCTANASANINVNPIPNVTVNSATICSGNSINVVATPDLPNGSYSWTPNIGTAGTNSVSPVTTTTYNVTYTLNGCSNTGSGTITVNPTPTITVTSDTICVGEQATLNSTPVPSGGTFMWNPSNLTTQNINVSPTLSGTYTVTYSLNNCTASGSGQITVNPLPIVDAGQSQTVCIGTSVTLNASGANTYSWDNGISNGVAFTPSVGQNTYTVTGTSAAGCIATDNVVVIVDPLPVVSFYPSDTFGCAPLNVTLFNTTPGVSNCVWTISDGSTLYGCNSVSDIFSQAGCYDVTLTTTTANGCTNSLTYTNLICVEAPPLALFTANPIDLTNLNAVSNMTNNSINALTYFWTFGDGSVSDLTNPTHTFPSEEAADYLITLIAYSAHCSDTAYESVHITEEIIFYVPNTFTPDGDVYNEIFKPVFTSGFDPNGYTLYIFNRWGELIFESHNVDVGWKGTYGSDERIVEDDTYTWKIIYKKKNDNKKNVVVGHVNVLK